MKRVMGVASAAIVASLLASTATWAVPTDKPESQRHPSGTPQGNFIEPTGTKVASVTRRTHHPRKVVIAVREPTAQPLGALPELPSDALTAQEQEVADVALEDGDRTFLMVDKGRGKILLFEDGEPVFIGNALTGASTADRLPPNETKEAMDKLDALDTKVTPAGRFTLRRGYDKEYGPLFDIKEIQGKDWGIAIHQVYLGIPSEHRAARLQSSRTDDKNITFGCINVAPETIQLLLRELPRQGATPLYVLPRDETKTTRFFAAGNT